MSNKSQDPLNSFATRLDKLVDLKSIAVFIKEREYNRRSFNWDDVCLDTTYWAFDSLLALARLEERIGMRQDTIHELRAVLSEEWVENVLPLFHDVDTGGFKQRPEGNPSLYSTDDACRLASEIYKDKRMYKEVPAKMKLLYKGVYEFLSRCLFNYAGAYSDEPAYISETGPSVASTYSAYHCVLKDPSSVGREGQDLIRNEELTNFVRLCRVISSDGLSVGFSNTPFDQKPCICTTFLSLKILERLGLLERTINRTEASRIMEFLRQSWKNTEGGFTWNPSGDRATLIHTRYSILTVKMLKERKLLPPETLAKTDWAKILKFVFSCQSIDGGFGVARDSPANMLGTRDALSILDILLDTVETDHTISSELKKLEPERIREFIESCRDSKRACYAGIPYRKKRVTGLGALDEAVEKIREDWQDQANVLRAKGVERALFQNMMQFQGLSSATTEWPLKVGFVTLAFIATLSGVFGLYFATLGNLALSVLLTGPALSSLIGLFFISIAVKAKKKKGENRY
jgi:prenyltransferase beta subunit